ncbi:MAG: zinc-ribbon domain-containing protein [Clostridia bacterium]|nr:zinc-ribbon domain-containing protein [Clostridia bacterium]MBQ5579933.1 zinc-ribbon domain-containing protein [Clostridia bacterium]
MICQCGARIPDNVEYCPYCGKRRSPSSATSPAGPSRISSAGSV